MNCSIYNNMQQGKVREKIFEYDRVAQSKPIGRDRRAVVESLPWLHCCDGKFHYKTRGNWGVDISLGFCPRYTGQEMVEAVREATAPKEKEMTWSTYIDHAGDGQKVKEWVTSKQPCLILFGGTGRGKTHLAKALQFDLVGQGKSVEMVAAQTLANHFMNAHPMMNREDVATKHDASRRINRLKTADFLIIDDLGEESKGKGVNDTFKAGLKEILDTMRGRLIVTTNWNMDGSETIGNLGAYESRIYSRLTQGAQAVLLKGTDFRQRIA